MRERRGKFSASSTVRASRLRLFFIAALLNMLLPLPSQASSSVEVWLFRGFWGGAFSAGLDDISASLNQRGINARTVSWRDRFFIQRDLLSDPPRHPVIIIGHSFGGNAALELADSLAGTGVRIPMVITLDPTLSGPVSSRVTYYRNYYLSRNAIGSALDGKPPQVDNIDIRNRPDIAKISESHWTMTENGALASEIFRLVLGRLK